RVMQDECQGHSILGVETQQEQRSAPRYSSQTGLSLHSTEFPRSSQPSRPIRSGHRTAGIGMNRAEFIDYKRGPVYRSSEVVLPPLHPPLAPWGRGEGEGVGEDPCGRQWL